MITPKIMIVAFDNTEYYESKLVEKCGRIADVYYYNASEVTNCCEVIPSYHLTYVTSHCEKTEDDPDAQIDIYDSLGEANIDTTDMYVHCHKLDSNSKVFLLDDFSDYDKEDYTDNLDDFIIERCKPHEFWQPGFLPF